MSALVNPFPSTGQPAPHPPVPRRFPRGVPTPARRVGPTGWGFVVACAGMLATALLGLLGLNVAISSQSFTVDSLESRRTLVAEQRDALRVEVARLGAPQLLDTRARALGMVPGDVRVPLPTPTPTPAPAQSPPAGPTATAETAPGTP